AVFWSAAYPESLFLALAAATLYHARSGRWWLAGLCGALAAATRNTGVFLATAIAVDGLQASGVPLRSTASMLLALRRSWPALAAAAAVGLGLVAYSAYLGFAFGRPLAWLTAQSAWGRGASLEGVLGLPAEISRSLALGSPRFVGGVNPQAAFEVGTLVVLAALTVAVWRRMPTAYAVFATLTIVAPLATGTTLSFTRYSLLALPCWLMLGSLGRHAWIDRLVMLTFPPLMALVAIVYSHEIFVA
ncbi:MAG: hypothetical protein NZ518_11915, partial [Dehalococcoidia bacterium]|nr:hypothetical protein [Dehalococcoidia bacterium]